MGQIKWYKRDPEAALRGMRKLSLEERGAYNTVLDLIYYHDGKLDDDDRFIAGYLGVDMRVWKRIKASLFKAGKLYSEAGLLRNEKADTVVDEALARVVAASYAGQVSAKTKAAKSAADVKKNKHLASTPVETPAGTGVQQSKNKKEEDIPDGISPPPSPSAGEPPAAGPADLPPEPPAPPSAATGPVLMPKDWKPDLTPLVARLIEKWPEGMLDRELIAFEAHARTNARTTTDWQAAFRTWLTKADRKRDEQNEQRRPHDTGTGNTLVDAALDRQARRVAGRERDPGDRPEDRRRLDHLD